MRKTFINFISLFLLIAPFSLTACNTSNSQEITTADIKVIGGTGSGTYNIGDSVTLIATVPTNKLFDYWSVNNKKVSEENPYTFTVSKTETYTACFKDDPNPPAPDDITCKLLVVSDVHISEDDPNSKNHLKNTLNYALNNEIDAIIFDGDTVNLSREIEYHAIDSVFTQVYKTPKAEGLPELIFNMGNHEFYPSLNCVHEETVYDREYSKFKNFAEKWGDTINDNVFMRDINGVRCVIAFPSDERSYIQNVDTAFNHAGDTVYLAATGGFSQNDINKAKAYFDDIIQSGYDKSILFFTHQPLGQTYGSTLYGMNQTSEFAFREMLKDYPMITHFSGHTHFSSLHERSISQTDWTSIQIGTHTYGKYVSEVDYDEDGHFLIYENITGKRYNDYDPQAKSHHGETNFGTLLSFNGLNMIADRVYLSTGEIYNHDSWIIPYGITKENKSTKFTYKNNRRGEQLSFDDSSEITTKISNGKLTSLSFEDVEQYWACEGYIIDIKDNSDNVVRRVLWSSLFWLGANEKQTYTIPLSQMGGSIPVSSGYTISIRGINFFGYFSNVLNKVLEV